LGGGLVGWVMLSWRPPVMHNGRTQTGRRVAQGTAGVVLKENVRR